MTSLIRGIILETYVMTSLIGDIVLETSVGTVSVL
jgi:hypothetical protein